MAFDDGHGPRTPSLVRRLELVGAADRERRNHVEAERGGVIVVDQEHDVRRVLCHPATRSVKALEQRHPIRLRGLAQVHRRADRRHVRACDACGDLRHYLVSGALHAPSSLGERPPFSIIFAYASWLMPVIVAAAYWKLLPSVAKIFARK